MAKTIRVYKSQSGDWVVKRDGTTKAAGRHYTQKEAYLHAKKIALNRGLSITVYYPNGGIKAVINPKNREEESNCFITTSCVKYYGLKDDCYELHTLRHFRDTYLLQLPDGKELVEEYYRIAPDLVRKLESDKNRKNLYRRVFSQIKTACRAIEEGRFIEAKDVYYEAISQLYYYFKTV